jgi:hypothetical protein
LPQAQHGLGALLDGDEPQVREPRDVALGTEGGDVELGERVSPPQEEGGVQQAQGTPVVPRRGLLPCLGHELSELCSV